MTTPAFYLSQNNESRQLAKLAQKEIEAMLADKAYESQWPKLRELLTITNGALTELDKIDDLIFDKVIEGMTKAHERLTSGD